MIIPILNNFKLYEDDFDLIPSSLYSESKVKILSTVNTRHYRNYISKKKNYLYRIIFTITDFYNENIVIRDSVIVRDRNVKDVRKKYTDTKLKKVIYTRHYPREIGIISILGLERVD